jgi:hypothetical protein
MSRRTALLAVLLCLGCSDDDSKLEQASLSIEASEGGGQRGQIGCQTLPLLQGSRSYETYVIDDLVTLRVTAEPGQVSVRFQNDGHGIAKTVTIPRSALLHGFASDVALQPLAAGEKYTIHLSSECPP